jgi:hypothetical protein
LEVDHFYAIDQSCGVGAFHITCHDELQAAAECVMKEACPFTVSNNVVMGDGFVNSFGGSTFISFASIIYAVGIM